jgi:putative MFS transporter
MASISSDRHKVAEIVNRLERLPLTSYQNKLFTVIASAWLADQVNVALLAFLIVPITVYFHLTAIEIGLLTAMTYLGQLIGNVLFGFAADRFGRRTIFQWTMVVWGVGSILAALSWNVLSLMAFRCLIGIGVGGEAPIAQSYVSEFIPAASRGKYISWMEGFWSVGYVLSGVITFTVLPVAGWRWVFALVAVLAAVVFIARRYLPESPRWLADNGRLERAESVMSSIENEVRKRYGKDLPEPSGFSELEEHVAVNPARVLFQSEYLQRTIMAFGLWFFALLGYFGLTSWLTTLLHEHGYSVISSIGFVTLISLGGIPGFFTAAYLIEKIGRKPTMALFLLGSAAMAYIYGNPISPGLLFPSGFFMQFFFFGMWCILYAYTPELYPTRARATGAGWASAVGRVGAIIGPVVVGIILKSVGTTGVFTLGAGSFVIAVLMVVLLGPETRSKVLEAIAK